MVQTQSMTEVAAHAADYAIDLSRNGISLYERVDATGWKLVETVPLQVGTLARNLDHLKLLAGGRDGIEPLVDVWLPQDQLHVVCIDFAKATSMEDAVFQGFTAAGAADPLSMSYDFQPALADGTTPVAGVPADVLREARDFLTAHGFEPGVYTTAELPAHFARPPEFPLLDPVAEAAPEPVAPAPVARPVTRAPEPAAPKSTPKPASRPHKAVTTAPKPRSAPQARPQPQRGPVAKTAQQPATSVAARMMAGGAVAAMIGLAAVGLPMLMAPADTRNLPGESAQTAAILEIPTDDAPAGSGLPPVAMLDDIADPTALQVLDSQQAATGEARPAIPQADRLNALIRPEIPAAPGADAVATRLPQADSGARLAGAQPQIEFSDALVLLDRFKANVMTAAISPPLPGQDEVAQHWPDIQALPARAAQPGEVTGFDPMLRFGRFVGDVQTIPDALAAKLAPDEAAPITVALLAEDTRAVQPLPAARLDMSLNVASFLGQVQTETLAPRRIVPTDEGGTTKVAELDLSSGRRAVQPLPMLRDDPALSLSRFEGTVLSVPGDVAGLRAASADDNLLPQIGTAHDTALTLRGPSFIARNDPAHDLGRFEGNVALQADNLSPDNSTYAEAAPRRLAQPHVTNPVRLAMALPTEDPSTRMEVFGQPVQTAIGALATTPQAIVFAEDADAPGSSAPVRIAALSRLDLMESVGFDEVLANARVIQPFAGQAPLSEILASGDFTLPVHISSKSPRVTLAALQLDDAAPAPASALAVPDQITLAAPGRSILDGGLLTPDDEPLTGIVPGMAALNAGPAGNSAIRLAALTTDIDQPLPSQALPSPPPDPTRTVTPNHVLVITGMPDIRPQFRPRPPQAAEPEVEVAAVDPTAVEVPVTDAVPAARADEVVAATPEGAATDTADQAPAFQLASAPTDTPDDPLVAVIPGLPAVVPPARPAEVQAALTEDAVPENTSYVSDLGVMVVASLPAVVPPNRFGAKRADDSTVMVLEPTDDQLTVAALIIKAQREGDLEPTNFSLSKASAPLLRPAGMVEAAREREVQLASLLPSDIALSAADSPRARPDNLKVVNTRPGVTPNVDIKASTFAPGPQLPTVANVARAATISNALPMRDMALIGVYGTSGKRHALLRLPNGKMVKVSPGDTVHGYQVSAISADAIRLNRRGKDTLLVIPD